MESKVKSQLLAIRDMTQVLTEELFVLQALGNFNAADKIKLSVAMESLGLAFKKIDEAITTVKPDEHSS